MEGKTPSRKYLAGYRAGINDGKKEAYNQGLYDGYNLGIEDFKAGLRSVWLKNQEGHWYVAEKQYNTDSDQAVLSGIDIKDGSEKIPVTPEQSKKLTDTIRSLLVEFSKKHPDHVGKYQTYAYLIPPSIKTLNWGIIDRYKLLITNTPIVFQNHIPESAIMFFVDYDL